MLELASYISYILYSGLSTSVSVIMAIILFVMGVLVGFTSGALVVAWMLLLEVVSPE